MAMGRALGEMVLSRQMVAKWAGVLKERHVISDAVDAAVNITNRVWQISADCEIRIAVTAVSF